MDWSLVLFAVAVMAGCGGIMGGLLAVAAIRFHVEIDPRVARVRESLPGANCGACGFPGCDAAAAAIVEGKAPPGACTAGGHGVREAVAHVLGIDASAQEPIDTVVRCQGGRANVKTRYRYDGVDGCHAAHLTMGGPLACAYGCLGFGDCATACPFDAISMGEDGLPDIDPEKCTRCGVCIATCPRKIIAFLPSSAPVAVLCVSHDKGKTVREACSVGCIACGACVRVCLPKAIALVDELAVIDYRLCNGCGACVSKCPTRCLVHMIPVSATAGGAVS